MNTISWKQGPAFLPHIKVVVSEHCYKTKTEVRGIADKRRPNNGVMLFRKVTVRIPTAYLVGDTLVCHPEYERRIREEVAKQMTASMEEIERAAFGMIAGQGTASNAVVGPSALTGDGMMDLIEYLTKEILTNPLPHTNNPFSIFRGGWTFRPPGV